MTSSHTLRGQGFQSRTHTHPAFSTLSRGQPLGPEFNVVIAVFTFYQPVGLIMVKEGSCRLKDGAVLYMKPRPAFMTQHLSVLTSCHGCIYWNKRRINRSRTHLFICCSLLWSKKMCLHICFNIGFLLFNHLFNFHLSKFVRISYVP